MELKTRAVFAVNVLALYLVTPVVAQNAGGGIKREQRISAQACGA